MPATTPAKIVFQESLLQDEGNLAGNVGFSQINFSSDRRKTIVGVGAKVSERKLRVEIARTESFVPPVVKDIDLTLGVTELFDKDVKVSLP